MRLIVQVTGVAAVLAALAGCTPVHSGACAQNQAYSVARNGAPLRAPDGLPAANTKNALKVPDVTAEAKPRTAKDGCLERPPPFYADRPLPTAPK